MTEELNWSENTYTLIDIDSHLYISSCIVKIEQGQELQSFLDMFAIKYFKNLFNVQAYKMNNNENLADTSTYGEQASIPINYTKCGTITPLYGYSHIFKTVEEMIMAFPRFVEVQDDLTFCSNNCLVHLKPGDHLELLKVEKTNTSGDQLVCQRIDNKEKIKLTASSIGHFKTLPDTNTYSIKDVLKILKLPQVINFKSNSCDNADLEGAEGNVSEFEFLGSYLLVGLQKSRAVVINNISNKDEKNNDNGYVLPLDSDLFQHLKYHVAFKNDFRSLKICESKSSNHTLDQDSLEMIKRFTQHSEDSATAPIPSHDIDLPETSRKSSTSGEKIAKKLNTTFELMKTKLKKTSSKEISTFCKNLTPVSTTQLSKRLYPSLSKIRLTPETKDNVYQDIENIALEGKSRFFSSAYASSVKPDTESDSIKEPLNPENNPKELGKMEKSRMHSKLPSGSDKKFYGTPPPIPKIHDRYNQQFFDNNSEDDGYENYHRASTLKVSNRWSGVVEPKNMPNDDGRLMDEEDIQTYERIVNSDMTSARRSKNNKLNEGVNVHSKMVIHNNGAEIDKDNAKDQGNSNGVAVVAKENTLYNDIANSKASTMKPAPKDIVTGSSSDDKSNSYNDVKGHFQRLSAASSKETSAPNSKQPSTTALQQNSKTMSQVKSKSSPILVQQNSTPIPVKQSSKPLTRSSSGTNKKQDPMTLPRKDSSSESEVRRPSLPVGNRPPMPIPSASSSSVTLPRSKSLSTTKIEVAEQTIPSTALTPAKAWLANRPQLPIPQPTTPTTIAPPQSTTSPTAESPAPLTTKTTKSPQQKPKGSMENSIVHASVKELCTLLETCSLHKVKDICQKNCLDGFFLANLPESDFQKEPFNLSPIEMMKLKMMLQGWKPKVE